jgi:hypothetical protein
VDGRVDPADWSDFGDCLLGPITPRTEGCAVFDFDLDDRVDLLDAAALQLASSSAALALQVDSTPQPTAEK